MGESGIASGSLSDGPFPAAPTFPTFRHLPGSGITVFVNLAQVAPDARLALAPGMRN